jgi:hypothetical protein
VIPLIDSWVMASPAALVISKDVRGSIEWKAASTSAPAFLYLRTRV